MGQDIELAVLFADVVGSTHIYDTMGDQRAREIVSTCIDLMRAATEARGGTVIKTMGDEVMATFPTVDEALHAATRMQRQLLARADLRVDDQPVSLRIGCHFGPVVLEARDVFGATVHTANRMTSQAKAGQIVTTAATVDRLPPDWLPSIRQIDVALLKGQGAEVSLYEVLWQADDVTSMIPAVVLSGQQGRQRQRLRLVVMGREIVLDSANPHLAFGRADDNDVVISGNLISRIHARIELERNKFVLVDQSTNGSFVHSSGGEEAFVRRDSLPLRGIGSIGLGKAPEPDSPQTIHFVCEAVRG